MTGKSQYGNASCGGVSSLETPLGVQQTTRRVATERHQVDLVLQPGDESDMLDSSSMAYLPLESKSDTLRSKDTE
jgi:hypothetical protein